MRLCKHGKSSLSLKCRCTCRCRSKLYPWTVEVNSRVAALVRLTELGSIPKSWTRGLATIILFGILATFVFKSKSLLFSLLFWIWVCSQLYTVYLLLTEFKGCTVSYRPHFFHFNFWPECEAHKKTRLVRFFYISWKLNQAGKHATKSSSLYLILRKDR